MDTTDHTIEIEGTVSAVIYQNAENGYTVLRLSTEEGSVTAVGCLPSVLPGEEVVLTGGWTTHQAYGQQFKAEWAERRQPRGPEAIFRYLASGAVKNIGPVRAREIVDMFGGETLDVIENEPEKLTAIRGISGKTALAIGDWYRRQVGLRRLMDFLGHYGIKPAVALRFYRVYGDESMAAVRDNPYILANETFGAAFHEADALALDTGFEGDSPQRVEAAVLFELSHNTRNGHVFLPREKLIAATRQLIGVDESPIEEAVDVLCDGGYVVREKAAGVDACYLERLHEAEEFTARRLREMAEAVPFRTEDLSRLIDRVEREQGVRYAAGQRKAVELAARRRVMVLTGGPGTGKTTSVRGILALFDKLGLKTMLCAPTGRAAKRMSELTGREAATIHRALGTYMGEDGEPVFEHDETEPLDCDAVIMDESSMVDIMLMHSLLSALRPDCRLVMVGDADQLPSVGPGCVFSDIIRSGAVESVTLTEIFRQAQESRIVKNAHLINRGTIPDLADNSGDFFFLKRSGAARTAETVAQLVTKRLPENMGVDPSQIQVLTPTRKREAGTEALNRALQAELNPPRPGVSEKVFGDFTFREGDKVMQIRNNYDIIWKSADGTRAGCGIFNGDVGVITSIDTGAESVTVDYDDRLVTYLFDQLGELEPAYAMTVHKAQGSEYRAVVLAVAGVSPRLLVRGVLYTAVTRARELLIIVGSTDDVETMIKTDRRARRYSGLRWRLAEG